MSTPTITDNVSSSIRDQLERVRYHISIIVRDRVGILGLTLLLLIVCLAVFAPYLAPYEPSQPDYEDEMSPPSAEHPLGTNHRGQDVLSRIIYGARPALLIGITTALGVATIGTFIGVVAGYYGGYVDDALMRLVDFTYGLPLLPFLILAVALFNPSLATIVLSMILILWRGSARVIRSQVLTLKTKPYIQSVQAAGASDLRILIRHIVPNILPLSFLYGSFAVGWAILNEANLAFLGFGDPAVLTWGKMLLFARQNQALLLDAWWWFFPPGFMVMALVISVFAIGRAYEEAINPEISEGET